MYRLTIVLVLGALVLAAAGCGGNKQSAGDTSSATSTSTTTESMSTESTSTTTGASGSTIFASGKCKNLATAAAKFAHEASAANASGNLQDAAKQFQSFVAIVPSEIKGDVQTIADAFSKYADALKGINFSAGQTPSVADLQKIQQAFKSVDQQKVTTAEKHIEAWTKANCT